MASSEFIPRENLSAWQRWELAALPAGADAAAGSAAAGSTESLRAELAAQAHAEGYAAGMATAATEHARLAALLATLGDCAAKHEQQLADEVLDLALVLARQLVGQALSVRRELVQPIVSAALKQLPQSTQRVELRMHPSDVDLVKPLLAAHILGARCEIIADALVAPGGCQVETEQCAVDATLPTRWRELLANLGRSDDWLEPL
ncbi:MAG: flagellar assembly protein FliH [Casimicrobiaceae bacterium]